MAKWSFEDANYQCGYDEGYSQGRIDAIDELAKKIKEEMKYYQLSDENIDEIAGQLKEK